VSGGSVANNFGEEVSITMSGMPDQNPGIERRQPEPLERFRQTFYRVTPS